VKRVLLDTVGLLALWEITDQWHVPAKQAMSLLISTGARLVTTSLVLFECGNAASRKPYRNDVDLLRRKMAADNRIIQPTKADLEEAWTEYRRGNAGIVEHVSFAIMRRLGITDAFTSDRHFKAMGFFPLFRRRQLLTGFNPPS
jgi:predicted nucleic acid-binding protein